MYGKNSDPETVSGSFAYMNPGALIKSAYAVLTKLKK